MPKAFKAFRFNPQLYANLEELASKNGYTVTGALEKFMSSAVEHGLVFPSAAQLEDVESEARIMLAWLQKGDYWVSLGGEEETSTRGRLLDLLPKVKAYVAMYEPLQVVKCKKCCKIIAEPRNSS